MSRWTDLAKWVGPTSNQSGAMNRHDGVVLHIAAGTYLGTISWQRNPDANVSSHFIVSKTGEIAQMVDTDVTAWTQRDGNGEWLSVENAGFLPDALTAAQVEANAKILARAHVVYGVPLQVTNTPATRGLGHHSMGAETGYDWGHPACPGEAIKAQKAAIVARAKEIVNGDDVSYDVVWRTDKMRNPYGDKATNPTIWPETGLVNIMAATDQTREAVARLEAKVAELASRPAAGTVTVTDEQLERVLRKVIGSVG